MALSLLGSTSRVETPIIYVKIGNYVLGTYSKGINTQSSYSLFPNCVVYPNYLSSLTIDRVTGATNTYTLNMIYAIRNGDDPNLLEKVFSSVSDTRTITLSYGDASIPTTMFKEEEAYITDVKSNLNMQSSTINYTVTCISKSLSLNAGKYSFGEVKTKPSSEIIRLLKDSQYGLQSLFYGMQNIDLALSKNLIPTDDKVVTIEAKTSITILEYLRYLVTCMTPQTAQDTETNILNGKYVLVFVDDVSQEFNGPYFEIRKVANDSSEVSDDVYEIEIGTNSVDKVISFSVEDNETYSILYKYAQTIDLPQYIYRINNKGEIDYAYSPAISNSSTLYKTTQSDKSWWTNMTQYPITCSVTLKGLLKTAVMATYVRLNVYFFGKKHISSGVYFVTKQTDTVSMSGSQTVLKLTRIGGVNYDN